MKWWNPLRWRVVSREALCPIRAAADQLRTEGWTAVMPFSIPNDCYYRLCFHTWEDSWAVDYARRGLERARAIEDGRTDLAQTIGRQLDDDFTACFVSEQEGPA